MVFSLQVNIYIYVIPILRQRKYIFKKGFLKRYNEFNVNDANFENKNLEKK